MLTPLRSRVSAAAVRISHTGLKSSLSTSVRLQRQGPGTGENFNQANDPLPRKETPNVSKSNELAVDAMGARDKPLQEQQKEGETVRQMQAPNRANIWSRSQMPRERAMTGPRFEQTIMETQVSYPCFFSRPDFTCDPFSPISHS